MWQIIYNHWKIFSKCATWGPSKHVHKDSILNLMNKETLQQDTSVTVVYIDLKIQECWCTRHRNYGSANICNQNLLTPFQLFLGINDR